jgi:hypothetical protein
VSSGENYFLREIFHRQVVILFEQQPSAGSRNMQGDSSGLAHFGRGGRVMGRVISSSFDSILIEIVSSSFGMGRV